MVLGVTRGTGNSGCYGLQITKVTEHADDIRTEFVQSRPTGIMYCSMALVPLTDFVVVPASPKPVVFTEKNG